MTEYVDLPAREANWHDFPYRREDPEPEPLVPLREGLWTLVINDDVSITVLDSPLPGLIQ